MATEMQSKVPFVPEVVNKCQCGNCPIHQASACVTDLVSHYQENIQHNPLHRDEIPGAYCAGGKATCPDLNFKQACVCGTCEIFNDEYNLAESHPNGYFCRGGAAS